MRLSLLSLLVLVAPVGTAAAQQDGGTSSWYLQLGGGGASQLDSQGYTQDIGFDTGYGVSAAIGRRTQLLDIDRLELAFELEGLFLKSTVDSDGLLDAGSSTLDELKNTAILVNAVVEWQWAEEIYFYAGGGLGYALDVTLSNLEDGPIPPVGTGVSTFELDDRSGFAYQGKLGLRYVLGGRGNLSATLGLRYYATEDIGMSDPDLGASFDLENAMTTVELGVRWGI